MKLVICLLTLSIVTLSEGKSSKPSGMEVKSFSRKYGFSLRVRLEKEELILKKGAFKVSLLPNATVALTNRQEVWFLKTPVLLTNNGVILPSSLIERLLKATKKAEYSNPKPIEKIIETSNRFNSSKDKIKFIVLDAGHGGKDPGNVHHGVSEKKVNLIITQKVAAILKKKDPNLRIVFTRNDDRFISLEGRSNMAVNLSRLNHQGLFVSIHANASLNSKSKGIETYFYSSNGSHKSHERIRCFRNLILPLSQNPKVHKIITKMYDLQISKESKYLAQYVNREVYSRVRNKTNNRGVKAHKPYFVITHNNLPSILVEVGFLSNSQEARMLMNSSHQYQVALGIATGIHRFITQFNNSKGFLEP